MTRSRPITDADLTGLPGLSAASRARLLERQPETVFEALCVRDIGRATTRELLKRGVLTDPEGVQRGRFTDEQFERWRRKTDSAWRQPGDDHAS
jgi:hypothetical protein